MSTFTSLLQIVAGAGVLFCAAAYVYGFILRSKGDRRLHTAGLLFSGFAMAAMGSLAPAAPQGPSLLAVAAALTCLWISIICQSLAAFRGRRGDRRAAAPADETLASRAAA